jgi:hypothetical protein
MYTYMYTNTYTNTYTYAYIYTYSCTYIYLGIGIGLRTLLNGPSHFTLDRIGGADANISYTVIFNSVFYIEWNLHSHWRILCLIVKYNLDMD